MKFDVNGQQCKLLLSEVTVAGTIDVYNAEFDFDESWTGFVKTAVFKAIADGQLQQEATEVILDSDDKAVVPQEELEHPGYLIVGIYGIKDTQRKPTIWSDIIKIRGSVDMPSITTEPTPSTYQQILNTYMDVKATETEVLDRCDELEEDFEDFQDEVEADIAAIDARVTAAEASVASAVATANAASATATAASQTAAAASQTVAGYNTRLTTAEGEIDTLQSDMTTAQGDITAIESDIDDIEEDVADHETRIDVLEDFVDTEIITVNALPATGEAGKLYVLMTAITGGYDFSYYKYENSAQVLMTKEQFDSAVDNIVWGNL